MWHLKLKACFLGTRNSGGQPTLSWSCNMQDRKQTYVSTALHLLYIASSADLRPQHYWKTPFKHTVSTYLGLSDLKNALNSLRHLTYTFTVFFQKCKKFHVFQELLWLSYVHLYLEQFRTCVFPGVLQVLEKGLWNKTPFPEHAAVL